MKNNKEDKNRRLETWKRLVVVEAILIGLGGFFIALDFSSVFHAKAGLLSYLRVLGAGFVSMGFAVIGIYAKLDIIINAARAVKSNAARINPLPRLRRSTLAWGSCWWVISLLVYAWLLYLTRRHPYYWVGSSILYHFSLLMFPVFLVLVAKKETFEGIGYKRVNLKLTSVCAFSSFITPVLFAFIRAFRYNKTIAINSQEPFLLFILSCVLYLFVAPVTEEIFHRGFLQTRLERQFGRNLSLILASFIFALIHIPKILFAPQFVAAPANPIPMLSALAIASLGSPVSTILVIRWLVSLFLMGMVFGFIYQRTGSVKDSIISHAFWNLGAFLLKV